MFDNIFLSGGECGIVSELFFASPFVRKVVINLNGVPGHSREESHRIFVERDSIFNRNYAVNRVIAPLFVFDARRSVINFPKVYIGVIGIELVF